MVINATEARHIVIMAARPVATIEVTIHLRLPDGLAARAATFTREQNSLNPAEGASLLGALPLSPAIPLSACHLPSGLACQSRP